MGTFTTFTKEETKYLINIDLDLGQRLKKVIKEFVLRRLCLTRLFFLI